MCKHALRQKVAKMRDCSPPYPPLPLIQGGMH